MVEHTQAKTEDKEQVKEPLKLLTDEQKDEAIKAVLRANCSDTMSVMRAYEDIAEILSGGKRKTFFEPKHDHKK